MSYGHEICKQACSKAKVVSYAVWDKVIEENLQLSRFNLAGNKQAHVMVNIALMQHLGTTG